MKADEENKELWDKKAVALKYEAKQDKAPHVIAKGRGLFAKEIIKIARKYGIYIEENEQLVSTLMMLDVGAFIPEELYDVIAHLLAFIYKLDKKKR